MQPHISMQRDGDQTSKDVGPSEAGHARRWVKVPKGWYAKKGNQVMEGWFVGDTLGKGMQVQEKALQAHPCYLDNVWYREMCLQQGNSWTEFAWLGPQSGMPLSRSCLQTVCW